MKKLLYCVAGLCLLAQGLGMERQLDSTLLVTKSGLEVLDGIAHVTYKCGTEWSVFFTDNGQTVTLATRDGHWTIRGLSSEVAVAAVSEGAPLVSAIAGGVGVEDVEDVTSRTLALAHTFASAIGSAHFDGALVTAVDAANDVFDDNGIHPIDFNDEILSAITLLGPSGGEIDASETDADDVHREAKKTIGTILNALASSGALASLPQVGGGDSGVDVADIAASADVSSVDTAALAAAAGAGADLSALHAGMDPALLAAAAAAGQH